MGLFSALIAAAKRNQQDDGLKTKLAFNLQSDQKPAATNPPEPLTGAPLSWNLQLGVDELLVGQLQYGGNGTYLLRLIE